MMQFRDVLESVRNFLVTNVPIGSEFRPRQNQFTAGWRQRIVRHFQGSIECGRRRLQLLLFGLRLWTGFDQLVFAGLIAFGAGRALGRPEVMLSQTPTYQSCSKRKKTNIFIHFGVKCKAKEIFGYLAMVPKRNGSRFSNTKRRFARKCLRKRNGLTDSSRLVAMNKVIFTVKWLVVQFWINEFLRRERRC